jgi:endo-1,4-beta-xylanase
MKLPFRFRTSLGVVSCIAATALAACSPAPPSDGSGSGGLAAGGAGGSAAGSQTGGTSSNAGSTGTGGMGGSTAGGGGGSTGAIGGSTTGGSATGGSSGTTAGGSPTGGSSGTMGGTATGGSAGTAPTGGGGGGGTSGGRGGAAGGAGRAAGGSGGKAGSGGSSTGGSGSTDIDCNAAMPTGGQMHSGNSQGGTGNLAWQIWSNVGTGNLTTFSTPAFSASWNNSGDYLGRLGYEWGSRGQAYTAYGTITAQFVARKSGTGGGYSYIGMYGWTNNPCIEWYIVDDSYNRMPVNPGSTTNKGTVMIDGGSYIMYTRQTSGTGGSRCSGVSSWAQYYSVRTTARACGQISLTEHFSAWAGLGMPLGNLLEAKILVEVGGGSGTVELPVARVTTTQ